MEQLLEGFNTGRPLLPYFPPAILGTFPSVYQLLPRTRHKAVVWDEDKTNSVENIFDPELWQKYGWGLSSDDEDTLRVISNILPEVKDEAKRKEIASVFQAQSLKQAEQFQLSLDRPARRGTRPLPRGWRRHRHACSD